MPEHQDEHISGEEPRGEAQQDGGASPPESGASFGSAWYVVKTAFASLIALLAVVIGILVLMFGVLQTHWGTAYVSDLLLTAANPYEEATLNADKVRGTWITTLNFYDVDLYREDDPRGETIHMAHVDTLELRYNLLGLLRRTIHIRDISTSGVRVQAHQREDEEWDILEPFEPPEEETDPLFAIRIDDIDIRDVQASAHFYPAEEDSTLYLTHLDGRLHDLYSAEDALRFDLQQLSARFIPPNEDIEREFNTSLALSDRALTIRQLDFESPYSELAGDGTLSLPGEDNQYVDHVDFHLSADPLDFRDLAGFVPDIDPNQSIRFTLNAEGTETLVNATLDATTGDGGRIEASGSFSALADNNGRRNYAVEAAFRDLDPFFYTITEDQTQTRLNADLSADLSGPSLREIDGPVQLDVFDSHWGTYTVSSLDLAADFDDGRADIDMSGVVQQASIQATGVVEPFEPEPAYDLRTRFANVDLRHFAPCTGNWSNIAGTLDVEGRGLSLDVAEVDARLNLHPSIINDYRLSSAYLDAQLRDAAVSFNTGVRSLQGNLSMRGRANNLDEVPRYRIEQGRLNNLDVAALTGAEGGSSINANFSLLGEGVSEENLVIEQARIDVQESFYGDYTIQSAGLNAAMRAGRLDVNGNLDMADAGTFQLTAFARPLHPEQPWAVTDARFTDVDIGVLAQQPEQSTSLYGTIQAEGRGATAETMRADAAVELDSSRVNEQIINRASLQGSLDRGSLSYNVDIAFPGGTTHLAGTAAPFADPITYTADGRFAAVNVGALLGAPDWETDLYGDLSIEGAGTDPEDMNLQVLSSLDESQINLETITEGQVIFNIDDGLARLQSNVSFEEDGSTTVIADVDLTEPELTFDGAINLHQVRVGQLAGIEETDAQLSADLQFSGRGTDPETMLLSGQVMNLDGTLDRIEAHRLDLAFELDHGFLEIERLAFRSNVATATGSGHIALFETAADRSSDFRLTGTMRTLDALQPYIEAEILGIGENWYSARIFGPYDALRFDVRSEARSLVYNDIRLSELEASVVGELDAERELTIAELDATANYFSVPQFTTERIGLEVTYQDDEVAFAADLLVDDLRDAAITGVVELQPDRQRIVFDAFDMHLDGDDWELLQTASITYNDEYRVRNFLLFSDDQQIAVDGAVNFRGQQSLALTIENFRIGPITDLLGYEGLDGRMSGLIDFTGHATDPRLLGSLDLDLISNGRPVGDLEIDLDYSDLQLNVDAALVHEDGNQFTAEGHLPMDIRLAIVDDEDGEETAGIIPEMVADNEMRLTLEAGSFPVDWVRPFIDEETISRIDGRLDALVDINGTPASPELSGDALFSNGLLAFPALGTTYREINARLEFTEDRINVRSARTRSGDGSLQATGTINMTELTLGEFDLDVSASSFLAVNTSLYRAVGDAELNLSGTTREPFLDGGIRLLSGDLYLGDELTARDVEEVQLTEEDLRRVEQRFGMRVDEADTVAVDFYAAMGMDINVRMERDTWLRSRQNPNMDVQFTGSLELQKGHYEEILLFGSIDVVPERSRVAQFGRRFDITEGNITFNGPVEELVMDIRARYEVPSRRHREEEATITLALSGRLDDLELELGSDPPGMDGTDVASYLLTGRPASAAFAGTGVQPRGLAGDIAFGQISGLLETAAGRQLGLDVMEIEQDAFRGVTIITAGSYVTPRLFLAVSQPVALGSPFEQTAVRDAGYTQLTLEYELQRWLLLRLLTRNYLEVNLVWEYAY